MTLYAASTSTETTTALLDRGGLRALAGDWEPLAQASLPGPFLLPGWLALFARDLAPDPEKLRVLVAQRNHKLVGALPLIAERRRLAGLPARVLRSISDDHSQRFDLLAAPGDDDAIAALWGHLAADRSWDAIELRDVPSERSNAATLCALAEAAGCPVATWDSQRSPLLALPKSVDEVDKLIPTKVRANLRRRKKNLAAELGPITLERVTGKPGLNDALTDGFALEACGWKGDLATAIASDPLLDRRYRALARLFARRGELSLYFLRAGGRRVAFHYAIERGGVYYLFKPGFDESLARHGLGMMLVHEVARDLVARGLHEIDFLGDDMPWKRVWTERVRPHQFRYIFRPTAWGRALHAWKFRAAPALKAARASVLSRLRPAATTDSDHASAKETE